METVDQPYAISSIAASTLDQSNQAASRRLVPRCSSRARWLKPHPQFCCSSVAHTLPAGLPLGSHINDRINVHPKGKFGQPTMPNKHMPA